jgi:hypothetical protein
MIGSNMIQQTVQIPEKDISLFLELAKKFKWKVDLKEKTAFELSDEQLDLLKKSSKTPAHLCFSGEDSLLKLNDL